MIKKNLSSTTFTRFSKSGAGFTLVELIVVIAIISFLAAIVLTNLGTAKQKAQNTNRIAEINQVRNALELYRTSNNGNYPVANGHLSDVLTDLVSGGHIPTLPIDEECSLATDQASYRYCNTEAAVAGRCLAEDMDPITSGNQNDPSTYAIAFWFNCSNSLTRQRYCATSEGIFASPGGACTQE